MIRMKRLFYQWGLMMAMFLCNTCIAQSDSVYIPLHARLLQSPFHSNITRLLNKKKWNELFPHRYGLGKKGAVIKDFYSFDAFVKAASLFPDFINTGDEQLQKRELAAFLANIAQETSGGWEAAPDGYFKWGLCFIEEVNAGVSNFYADTSKHKYPPVEGKYYFGRGPKQLSWNYNYGQLSEAWFGDKQILLNQPEQLSADPVLSFASAIWFWMTPQYPKPSCHDIICGKWMPNSNDLEKGRVPGFGATVNVINGGVECGGGKLLEKTKYRYQYYDYFCKYWKLDPGDNISCANQQPFGQ